MLYIVFQAGSSRYALDARAVMEVIPRVSLRACPGAPDWVAGVAQYRGDPLPVIDLCRRLAGAPCPARLSSRILVARVEHGTAGPRAIGLLGESVVETVERAESDFAHPAVAAAGEPCLGRLAADGPGLIQQVSLDRLVPDEVAVRIWTETSHGDR